MKVTQNKASQNRETIAVIGAGVVGLCTAIELQQLGFQVSLFDKEEPAQQTSFGNAAYIAAEYTEPLATPQNIRSAIAHTFSRNAAFKVTPDHGLKFIPWGVRFLKSSQKKEITKSRLGISYLNARSVDSWEEILKLAGNSDALIESGFLKVWEKKSDLSTAKRLIKRIKSAGHEIELLQGSALFDLEPALTKHINHGVLYPNGRQLNDTYDVCLKLFKFFKEQGGHFIKLEVKNIQTIECGIKIQTTNGEYSFDKTVIAAGVWSKQLLKQLNLNIPLAAERGYHLTLPEISDTPKHVIESVDRHVVLSSLGSGLRIVGFGEYGNIRSKPIEKRYGQLQYHLSNIIKDIDCQQQPIKKWMGIRPTFPDSLPVIDLHPQYSNIGMVFGHHHLGVTQAAISAKLIAWMINKDRVDQEVAAYSVTRFP